MVEIIGCKHGSFFSQPPQASKQADILDVFPSLDSWQEPVALQVSCHRQTQLFIYSEAAGKPRLEAGIGTSGV